MDYSGAPGTLGVISQAFSGEEAAGLFAQLYIRLARFLGGDPTGPHIAAQSAASGTIAILPVQADAQSCLLYVSDNSIFYRLDGTNPVAGADFFVPQGSQILLTGQPSMLNFRFTSAAATPANLYGTFFT